MLLRLMHLFNKPLYVFYISILFYFIAGCGHMGKNMYDPDQVMPVPQHIPSSTITYTYAQLNLDNSLQVQSHVQKFIIPVPRFPDGGEPLVVPEGYEHAGDPLKDWQGKPKHGKGIVFFNYTDNSLQGAPADGESVIIINQVTNDQAKKIEQKINDLLRLSHYKVLDQMPLGKFKALLRYIHEELKIGDMYDSNRAYVDAKLVRSAASHGMLPSNDPSHFGLYKAIGKTCQAFYIVTEGSASFQGPAGSPQCFHEHAFIVQDLDGSNVRLVQANVFLETYRTTHGHQIYLAMA